MHSSSLRDARQVASCCNWCEAAVVTCFTSGTQMHSCCCLAAGDSQSGDKRPYSTSSQAYKYGATDSFQLGSHTFNPYRDTAGHAHLDSVASSSSDMQTATSVSHQLPQQDCQARQMLLAGARWQNKSTLSGKTPCLTNLAALALGHRVLSA